MKVLVTGGAGFIGGAVSRRLVAQGHDLLVIDDLSGGYRRNVPGSALLIQSDITNPDAMNRWVSQFRPDVIFHAAAYAAEGLSHWMRRYTATQNLVGWANIANAAVRHKVRRIVTCSSMSVYGSQTPPFTEDMPLRPEDPYGATKAAVEFDIRALGDLFGVEWSILRPHNVYGPGQNLADPYRNVVAIFMRRALEGKPLTVFGDGTQTRAFSYINDVAAVAEWAVTGETHGFTMNVGGEDPVTIKELADLVIAATGSTAGIDYLDARYEVPDAWCDHAELRRLYGEWSPTDLGYGMVQMVNWARSVEVGPLRRYDYEHDVNFYEAWRDDRTR